MSFKDLFRKKTLRIMNEEGVTLEDVRTSKDNTDALEAAATVAINGKHLAEYYAKNTWCGDNSYVDRAWEQAEKDLRNLARAIKRSKQLKP